ncbi:hypothetical protein [Pseudoalteromonas sp. SWXJZ10B]|uniref:hypothetical protein n=1 Tax=Pseudoalteromonas sp. SWXJZ10B TaxID=2792063 RepID=UPI0018CE2FC2|nr:hypothetical protein [Pseudoalteromonas sp. SWXJZ10B]MBH0041046.1 hypothetical protein [Pseudoalteromonas sp. SWXJZ10B]
MQDLEDAFISLKIEIKALSKDDDSVTKVKQFLDEQKKMLEEFVIFSDRNVVLISNLKSILEAEDLLLKIEQKNVNGIANAALQTSRFDLYTKIIVKTDDVAADNEKLKRESEQLKSKISKYEDSIENEKK